MGQKYALLIGNTNYKNLPPLTTPDDDVKNLTRVLREPKIGGFNQVTPLVDRPINEIMLEVSKLFKDRKPDDLVLLYFSGHGVMDHDRNSLYLATHDTDSELLRATAIPSSFIQDEMDNCGSRQVVLILDCCYSGVLASGAKGALDDTVGTANHFRGNGRGKIILTASDKRKVAWEGNRVISGIENSLYTYFLIQGLESGEADIDQDDQIPVEELHRYTARKLAETGKQTPLMKKWDDDTSEIIIARNPVVKPIPLPAYLQTMIQSSDKDLRVTAVHELDRLLSSRPEEGWVKSALAALQQLANDDSRRVSNVAAAALEALVQKRTTADGSANAGQGAARKAEAEHLAREKVEEERIAKEKLEAERLAAQQVEAERLSREKAKQEHTAKEKTEAERLAAQRADRVGREKAEAEKHKGSTGVEITCEKPWYSFIPGYDVTCKIESTLGKTNIKLTLGNTQFIDLQPDVQYHLALSLEWARISGEGAADTTFTLAKGEILKLSYRSPIISGAGTKLVVKGRSLQK